MEKRAETLLVNQKTFAALWGVSAGTIKAWIDAGMPSVGGGKSGAAKQIDLYKALPWCKEHFNRAGQYESQKERKAALESDLLEIKLHRELQTLLDFDFVSKALTKTITELINDLFATPGRRCQEYAAEDSAAVIRARMFEDAQQRAEKLSQRLDQLAEFSEATAGSLRAGETSPDADGG